jgi:uncharacterized protein YkuJ
MNKNLLMQIGVSVVMIAVLIGIIALILAQMGIQIQQASQITYEKCCGGVPCSDTYYDEETKTCKLVFEEQQKYYPFAHLDLISLGIVFGVALLLTLGIKYFIPYSEEELKIINQIKQMLVEK